MKIKIPRLVEINVASIKLDIPVDFGEEEMPNDFPLRTGDVWTAVIDIDTGAVENWPAARPESVYLTVKDAGTYTLFDENGTEVAKRAKEYVPHGVVPGRFGDSVELEIDGNGVVTNWHKCVDVMEFFPTP